MPRLRSHNISADTADMLSMQLELAEQSEPAPTSSPQTSSDQDAETSNSSILLTGGNTCTVVRMGTFGTHPRREAVDMMRRHHVNTPAPVDITSSDNNTADDHGKTNSSINEVETSSNGSNDEVNVNHEGPALNTSTINENLLPVPTIVNHTKLRSDPIQRPKTARGPSHLRTGTFGGFPNHPFFTGQYNGTAHSWFPLGTIQPETVGGPSTVDSDGNHLVQHEQILPKPLAVGSSQSNPTSSVGGLVNPKSVAVNPGHVYKQTRFSDDVETIADITFSSDDTEWTHRDALDDPVPVEVTERDSGGVAGVGGRKLHRKRKIRGLFKFKWIGKKVSSLWKKVVGKK